ncbi:MULTISPECIES: HNH endonuclease family protein [unclassified Pseudoclavibacter]|uniref:HNH endonuclease family protein n=1 Tax=unclassified Pseudoclavibacter TaxID=2615177 RepID=UPI001BAC4C82|nr:HNH endonuclease family protein [Pseudoclavibacter sp. Marseille-Q4354]MBS3179173.1 HNH endonuclease [Pseudoclavibacter sp. Marseille-Q4354]
MSLGVAVLLVAALDVTVGETPAFAVPPQESSPAGAVDSSVASLSGSGLIIEIDGVWCVDGASVAAAAGLRTVNSSQVGYDRDLFAHWSDPDGNGCDARNDILQRDLTNIALRAGDGCVVERGTLTDPYTGDVISFTRGVATSGAVHIDHIVPLAAAWTGGANTWDAGQREAFANDLMNLQAVDGRANSAKGSRLASRMDAPECRLPLHLFGADDERARGLRPGSHPNRSRRDHQRREHRRRSVRRRHSVCSPRR